MRWGDYPRLSVTSMSPQEFLKMEEEGKRGESWKNMTTEGQNDAMQGLDPPLLALEMEEGSHKLRNMGGLEKLEKANKYILLKSFKKAHSPAYTLNLAH